MRLELRAAYNNVGTVRNIAYDSISASILAPLAPSAPSGLVNGNLVQFDSEAHGLGIPMNGPSWIPTMAVCWLIRSATHPRWVAAPRATSTWSTSTPRPAAVSVPDCQTRCGGNPQIQNDDHNVGALLVLPDGRYLAMYANHGNNGGLGDEWSPVAHVQSIRATAPRGRRNSYSIGTTRCQARTRPAT